MLLLDNLQRISVQSHVRLLM